MIRGVSSELIDRAVINATEIDESDPDQESMDINIEELPPITDSESEYLALFPPEKTMHVELNF